MYPNVSFIIITSPKNSISWWIIIVTVFNHFSDTEQRNWARRRERILGFTQFHLLINFYFWFRFYSKIWIISLQSRMLMKKTKSNISMLDILLILNYLIVRRISLFSFPIFFHSLLSINFELTHWFSFPINFSFRFRDLKED